MNNKDTVYIDIDDEITSIIEKVRNSDSRLVALVLPKRASVLQSVVNMKLLKRTADDAKKQVVLITSEAGLLPLAGSIGMYVASTLQSKPAVPDVEIPDEAAVDDLEEPIALDDFDPKAAAATPVGALAKPNSVEPPAKVIAEPETVDLDDEADTPVPVAADAAATKPKKTKGDKKLAVPNFNSFRKRLALVAVALIVIIVGAVLCLKVLPKATITATTDTSDVSTNQTLTLSTQQKTVSTSDGILPSEVQQSQKTSSQQTAATGQKNAGTKATGTVTISIRNCTEDNVTVPAGTGVSSNGLTFITQGAVQLESVTRGGRCVTNDPASSQSVSVTAASGGANYNLSPSSFTVSSLPDGTDPAHLSASSSSAFSGGSDNNIKVVAQADIDSAKQKLGTADSAAAKQQLVQQLQADGYEAIDATFTAGTPSITTSANAGDQADNVTVTQTIVYSIFGVKKSDLEAVIAANVNKQINTSKQQIQDDGLSKATYKLNGATTANSAQVAIQVVSTAGPKLDVASIKAMSAGKKSGDIKTALKDIPGVQDVTVKLSPFWVSSVPKDTGKITVNFVKSSGSSDAQ